MRQVWITKAGSPDVLQVRQAPDPIPREGEVRIRVEASGINFADLMARMGLYPDAPKIPCVVGYEVAGRVDALGEGVTEFQVGQDVLALTHFGGYADVVCVPAISAFARPSQMSAQVGAGMLVNYVTAYQLLVVMGSLHQGDRVLIQSAAGGIGLAALDICRIYDAETIGLASAAKHEFLHARGLHHAIDSRGTDVVKKVQQISKGEGVELVLDSQGGPSWRQSYSLLAPTGRLLTFGVSSLSPGHRRSLPSMLSLVLTMPRFTPLRLMDDNRGVLGVNIGHLWHKPHLVRGWAEQILAWYEEGKIAPHIDRAFPFDQAPAAHQYLHDRKAIGKVLLEP
ncbi:MAG TPA: medium chain dehydrogenase/reductase family protein [Ktedonosporobacter sp.]|nr:medium chain dehydrogenase/reductase family protein [Ktedonosporobacter sp.]